jgi:hypothetical protein
MMKTSNFNSEEQKEIKSLKDEELKEERFWQGYSNKLREQVRSENIFQEVENFKNLRMKEENNFFKKFLKTLGF